MSSRNQRRLANKAFPATNPIDQLSNLVPKFKEILEAGEAMTVLGEKLNPLLEEMQATQEAFEKVLTAEKENAYEIKKQRWVTLRFLDVASSGLLVPSYEEFEEVYRAQFDGIQALIHLIEAHKQRTSGQ